MLGIFQQIKQKNGGLLLKILPNVFMWKRPNLSKNLKTIEKRYVSKYYIKVEWFYVNYKKILLNTG